MKQERVIFINHPFVKGHAQPAKPEHLAVVQRYTAHTSVNSAQFEALAQRMAQDHIVLEWRG